MLFLIIDLTCHCFCIPNPINHQAEVVKDPARRAKFKQFANTDEIIPKEDIEGPTRSGKRIGKNEPRCERSSGNDTKLEWFELLGGTQDPNCTKLMTLSGELDRTTLINNSNNDNQIKLCNITGMD